MLPDVIRPFDSRRDMAQPGDHKATLRFCIDHFIHCAREAIQTRQRFIVALSGGSTPKSLYQALASPPFRDQIDWQYVFLFWSDERAVPPTDPDSNFLMAMEAGLAQLPIPKEQIFRMQAEGNIGENAQRYEEIINTLVPDRTFDLILLGMGEDGHVASLFPHTEGLTTQNRLVIENYIPQKNCWRMTFTFTLINQSRCIAIYVLGESKAQRFAEVLLTPDDPMRLPAQSVGTSQHKSLWIADNQAAKILNTQWTHI